MHGNEKFERVKGAKALESTRVIRYFLGVYYQRIPCIAITQRLECLLRDVESLPCSVDGGNINPYIVRWVNDSPARAAVSGVPNDVVCAPDRREVGDIVKSRVCRGKTILPI